MQNNPFNNFLAQLQGAANNIPSSSGQDASSQSTASFLGNANLLGAMQNALARGSTSVPGAMGGNVIGSLAGALPSSSTSPDMSVFRQFQLQQNQPLPAGSGANSLRTASSSGATALLSGSPTAAGNVQALSATWNSPANPGAALNTLQVPSSAWNNPGMAAATGTCSNPAAGTANFAGQAVNNNPLMNAMLQTYLSQQVAMQQAQTNPMAGLMQQMMQSMMPFNAVPPAGAQLPNLDPNVAKQLLVQLVGQLQQSGQLSNDDSIQQLLQPVAGTSNEATSNVALPKLEVFERQQSDDMEVKEENEETVVAKKTPRGTKGKGKGTGSSTDHVDNIAAGTGSIVQGKGPGKKGRPTKKSALAVPTDSAGQSAGSSGAIGVADKSFGLVSSVKTEEGVTPSGRRKSAAGKSGAGYKNIPEVVAIDSDSDENSSSFHAVETASEGSSVVEGKKGKKGKGRGKSQEKATKKPGKDQSAESAGGLQKTKQYNQWTIPEPVRRIKVEDTVEDELTDWIASQSRSSPRIPVSVLSEPSAPVLPVQVKSEESADVKPVIIPPGVQLRKCEVRLQKMVLKRDARGNFIIPQSSQKAADAGSFKTEPSVAGKSLSPYKADLSAGGRKSSPGASRDVSMTQSHGIKLLPNLNAASQPQMRTLYVGHMKGNMQWLNLIGWAKSRCFCQCAFCPILSETPKAILSHIRSEHPDLTFALTKMKQPSGKFLYIFCRHCDFIALDVTINWLHFEVYHNISDILEGTARPRIEDFAPAKLEVQRGLEDIMETQLSYMCYDCELITDDSKQLAIHVLQQHADTVHYNGCFVKLLGIRRPLKSENVPFKRIVSDEEFAEFRQEAFICMMCDYIAHCPYMALSHNLNTHQTKRILFSCMEKDCAFNCVSETQMIQHLSGRHKLKSDLTCSSTLLEPSHGGFVECAIGVNRKTSCEPSLQRCNVRPPSANPARISPVTFTTDEDTEDEDNTANGEDSKKQSKTKIKVEGSGKNSLQCTAVSSSRNKGLENGDSEVDEDNNEEGKLPDDIQITINPPSPDEAEEGPNSPSSDGSNDTIVEGESNKDEVPAEEKMAVEEAEISAAEDASVLKADGPQESAQPPALESVSAKDSDDGAGDFAADIPPEPYCLSTDVRLQVPSADALGTDVSGEGASRDA